ncbi:MAG: hypothetical protein WA955_06325 [Diaphorobacter nitroreducens]|uniref:hypothetical protein n=1 Tax=Diaphorobacter nitroreducens TaxID=164759 RepID=UPI003C73838F
MATFAPANVLDFGGAQLIYELASAIFPAVKKMKGDYSLGQVAKLYYSFIWITSPLMFWGAYLEIRRQSDSILTKCKEKKIFFVLFFLIFSPLCTFILLNFSFESKNVDDIRVYLSFHSRLGMPVWGGIVPTSASVMAAMTAFGIRYFCCVFD